MAESAQSQIDVSLESSIPKGAASLESILCTEELQNRPSRPPNYEKENYALRALVSALADSPSTIFQTLAETIQDITQCDSAGLSLLTADGKTPDVCGQRFYWPAIAGMWNPHVGGGTPRDFGPCGDVLDHNRTLLFRHFERRYPYLVPVSPSAEECLLVPFYVGGQAVGTIWAIMHSDRRKFDAEDDRVMASLGKFASSAYQALKHIEDLKIQVAEREKAEAEVRKLASGLEAKIRRLVEANVVGIIMWHLDGAIIEANDAFLRLVQYSREDLTSGRVRWTELTPAQWHDCDKRAIGELKATGIFQPYEKEFFRKDGVHLPVLLGGALFEGGGNEGVAFILDLSEQKRAAKELRAAMSERARLAEVCAEIGMALARKDDLKPILDLCAKALVRHLDAAFARIWTLNRDGRELELQASAGIYTRLDGHFGRIPFGKFKIGSIAQSRKPTVTNDVQNDPRVDNHEWARAEKIISFAGYPLVVEDRAVGVLGMFSRKGLNQNTVDTISFLADGIAQSIERKHAEDAQKRAQEELRRSEAFLAEAQHLSQIGSFSWRVATDEITWSEQLYRIYELESGVPVTLELIRTRVHPEDLTLYEKMVEQARNGGNDFEWQYRLMMPDHSIKCLHAVAHATLDQNGQREYIAAIQDVTVRRRSEEALDKARSQLAHMASVTSLGVLTASIAHEVNQPLSGIVTNASTCLRMLGSDSPNVEGARETARRAIRDANRASDVITRLRALYGRKGPVIESVNLNEAAREVIALSLNELQRNRVILRLELADGLPPVAGDRVQLQQVILNLLRNASDAMSGVEDRPRELVIRTGRSEGDRVRLSVQDAGIGLEPQTTDRLFEAFYTTKSDGMGMGLSVSRSIIQAHEGRLWAAANEGPGATFSFAIPCRSKGLADAEAPFNQPKTTAQGA